MKTCRIFLRERDDETLQTPRTVCPHDCPDTCSIAVTVDEATGRAVKILGNAEQAFTAGFLCAKVNRYLDRVYHPERLQHAQRRVGARGEGRFERISWDEATAIIMKKFRGKASEAILP